MRDRRDAGRSEIVRLLEARAGRLVVPLRAQNVGRAVERDLEELGDLVGALVDQKMVVAERRHLADPKRRRFLRVGRAERRELVPVVELIDVFGDRRQRRAVAARPDLELQEPRVDGVAVGLAVGVGERVLHQRVEELSVVRHRERLDPAVGRPLGVDRRDAARDRIIGAGEIALRAGRNEAAHHDALRRHFGDAGGVLFADEEAAVGEPHQPFRVDRVDVLRDRLAGAVARLVGLGDGERIGQADDRLAARRLKRPARSSP